MPPPIPQSYNTALGSGNASGTSAGPALPTPPGTDPTVTRYDTQLADIKKNAAFGVYIPDVVTARSKGSVDYNRDIILQVHREFFSMTEYMQGIYWSLTLGAFAGALSVAILTPGGFPEVLGEGAAMLWGVFLLSFGISSLLSETGAHSGIRKCTHEKYKHDDPSKNIKAGDYKVAEEFRGRECLTDFDCTDKSSAATSVCKYPPVGSLSKLMRHVVTPIVLFAGVLLTIVTFTTTGYRLQNKDLAQVIIYGIGMGTFFAIMFS